MNLAARNPSPLLDFDSSGALDIFQAPRYQDVLSTFPVPLANALNQDGTRNSATNPARLGSTITIFATGFGQLGGSPAEDGMPGGNPPQWPGDYVPNVPFPTPADILVVTPSGNLALPSLPIATIVGRTNAVLQVQATVPVYAYGFPAQLPFVIGPPANGSPVWTNFIYIAR